MKIWKRIANQRIEKNKTPHNSFGSGCNLRSTKTRARYVEQLAASPSGTSHNGQNAEEVGMGSAKTIAEKARPLRVSPQIIATEFSLAARSNGGRAFACMRGATSTK